MPRGTIRAALFLTLAALSSPVRCADAVRTDEQIRDDWLTQARVRWESKGEAVSSTEDALGGCDGVKNGLWGFHTAQVENPWWQVDLGQIQSLARVVVYNRCDGSVERVANLVISLSSDGEAWTEAFRNDGAIFYGASDGKPLLVDLGGSEARFVRLWVPTAAGAPTYFHLDEVEVYGAADAAVNLALWADADQSGVSQWSARHYRPLDGTGVRALTAKVAEQGLALAASLREQGQPVSDAEERLREALRAASDEGASSDAASAQAAYLRTRAIVRDLQLGHPLLHEFDDILFVKRIPCSFSHMSDQYYGWWSRGGGGIYVLEDYLSDSPRLRCLTEGWPLGSFLRPDLSYDGTKLVFAYCRYYPEVAGLPDKFNKANVPEDAFYHVYEMNLDGSGVRQLTRGRYDDFDARYLPNDEIVFLSTRRGAFLQAGLRSAQATLGDQLFLDCFVRCGGDNYRPVAVYTLHVMDRDGGNMRAISPFENFEWTPSVTEDGRILYARWDYIDRDNMPYMSLWSTNPDGTNPQIVYGNFTRNPHCTFEPRQIPGSRKFVLTASGHHAVTGGSLLLFDPARGVDGEEPLRRLTPEVCFPETEGWPPSYYADPYPLSEEIHLTAWSPVTMGNQVTPGAPNGLGLYVYDAFGNLELLYRDPDIASETPIPVRPRPRPGVAPPRSDPMGPEEGTLLVLNVYDDLGGIEPGAVRAIRVVGIPPKVQPHMNTPSLGITRDDPGKFILGTAPVEEDGSAYFRAPSGVSVFFQALDQEGFAIQTMRTATYVQPGQALSCIGCHENRASTPTNMAPKAMTREASRLTPGPEGTWPLRYDRLVQPVLDRYCVSCHGPSGADAKARALDLTATASYDALIAYGSPSLTDQVWAAYRAGRSVPGEGVARNSKLMQLLLAGHEGVELDEESLERLVAWADVYAQRQGSYSEEQERMLLALREDLRDLIAE